MTTIRVYLYPFSTLHYILVMSSSGSQEVPAAISSAARSSHHDSRELTTNAGQAAPRAKISGARRQRERSSEYGADVDGGTTGPRKRARTESTTDPSFEDTEKTLLDFRDNVSAAPGQTEPREPCSPPDNTAAASGPIAPPAHPESYQDPSSYAETPVRFPFNEALEEHDAEVLFGQTGDDEWESLQCELCYHTRRADMFPFPKTCRNCGIWLPHCLYCISETIKHDIGAFFWRSIVCPSCYAELEYDDVRKYADSDTFEKYMITIPPLLKMIDEY